VIQEKMAVRIRMTRMGTKKKPFYRIVAADSEAPRDGKFIEILGHYDPMRDPAVIKVDEGKVNSWMEKGARVSESVKSLLKKQGKLNAQSTAS
jgi:small subunit ribosomal protein S16